MKTVLKTAVGKNVFLCALLAALCFTSCGGESKVVKYLRQDINDSAARYWASFVEENGINAIDEDGDTLLYYAVEKYNDAHLVELCLNAKADCTLQPRGRKPLIDSAFKKFNPEVLDVLFKHGVPVRGDKYDLLYSAFFIRPDILGRDMRAAYVKFLLPYYTEKQMDYRNYDEFYDFSSWGLLIELDKKGYKPNAENAEEFIKSYIRGNATPELEQARFGYLKKYIGDKWYKENNQKLLIDVDYYIMNFGVEKDILYYEYATRFFQVLDEFLKNGYTLKELGAMQWLYTLSGCKDRFKDDCYKYHDYDKRFSHFVKLLNYAKENGLNLNERLQVPRSQRHAHILDVPLSDLHRHKSQLKSYEEKHLDWASDESSEHQNYADAVKKSETIVNVLLENGINTVSAIYQTEVEELGLTDKITVATDEE